MAEFAASFLAAEAVRALLARQLAVAEDKKEAAELREQAARQVMASGCVGLRGGTGRAGLATGCHAVAAPLPACLLILQKMAC